VLVDHGRDGRKDLLHGLAELGLIAVPLLNVLDHAFYISIH
jgi:hypothetical protein